MIILYYTREQIKIMLAIGLLETGLDTPSTDSVAL